MKLTSKEENEIIKKYDGLVWKLARKYGANGFHITEDLHQEGQIGVLEAIRYYDPEKGVPFEKTAALYITKHIQRYLQRKNNFIRVPFDLCDTHAFENRVYFAGDTQEATCLDTPDYDDSDNEMLSLLEDIAREKYDEEHYDVIIMDAWHWVRKHHKGYDTYNEVREQIINELREEFE